MKYFPKKQILDRVLNLLEKCGIYDYKWNTSGTGSIYIELWYENSASIRIADHASAYQNETWSIDPYNPYKQFKKKFLEWKNARDIEKAKADAK